jgi:hypothetical protein
MQIEVSITRENSSGIEQTNKGKGSGRFDCDTDPVLCT